jgi:hypothetical protein
MMTCRRWGAGEEWEAVGGGRRGAGWVRLGFWNGGRGIYNAGSSLPGGLSGPCPLWVMPLMAHAAQRVVMGQKFHMPDQAT